MDWNGIKEKEGNQAVWEGWVDKDIRKMERLRLGTTTPDGWFGLGNMNYLEKQKRARPSVCPWSCQRGRSLGRHLPINRSMTATVRIVTRLQCN